MENETEEIWKETSIPGYFVSNLGGFRGRSGKPEDGTYVLKAVVLDGQTHIF